MIRVEYYELGRWALYSSTADYIKAREWIVSLKRQGFTVRTMTFSNLSEFARHAQIRGNV